MRSQIRESTLSELREKVRKHSYGKYLLKIDVQKIRGFSGESIRFDFPITALIGPNGGGKSSIMGIAGCAYKSIKPSQFFPKSAIGDNSMSGWKAEYEIIDKDLNNKQSIRRTSNFRQMKWARSDVVDRPVRFFGIERTVPAGEKAKYKKLMRPTYSHSNPLEDLPKEASEQIQHILGKSVENFKKTKLESNDDFLIGNSSGNEYSEFHFGAGESSIIRMVTEIETAPPNSLILIEEIENGLHPLATQCMVEYLIDVAKRKSSQIIFTTHSDYALTPLPPEGIWACIDGKLQQGKLSVTSLRAISGRIEKNVVIFVEDKFAEHWVKAILRQELDHNHTYEQIEIHAVAGDSRACKIHRAHMQDPSSRSKSICVIDGDSQQEEDNSKGIFRLPGEQPEFTVFNDVRKHLEKNIAKLTLNCQLPLSKQEEVKRVIIEASNSNRDPHILYSQIGERLGFISEEIIRGAFLSIWVQNHFGSEKIEDSKECDALVDFVKRQLNALHPSQSDNLDID